MRDRRWDFLYDRQKQPVKDVVVERLAEELARQIDDWPPPFADGVSEELRRRWAAGAAARPPDEVVRLALELSRLDLARDLEAYDERVRNAAPRSCRGPADEAALHLLSCHVTEACLSLQEWAEGARLTRADLARAVELAERRLFRVTLR